MTTPHASRFPRRDGSTVRAAQFDGRVAGFFALLAAFPGRVRPDPHRDDAVLVIMASGGHTRIAAGDWVVELPGGALACEPDDQFRIALGAPDALAA